MPSRMKRNAFAGTCGRLMRAKPLAAQKLPALPSAPA